MVQRVRPVFSKEAEFKFFYCQGKDSLKDREKAKKFLETVKKLNLSHVPVPTIEELDSYDESLALQIVESIWARYYLTMSPPINTIPL